MKPTTRISQRRMTCNANRLPYVPKKHDVKKLIGLAKDSRILVVMFLGIFFGLRIGEIVRLRWRDIDFEDNYVRILDSKNVKRYKSGYGKDRQVVFLDQFKTFLIKWRQLNPEEEYVIPYKGYDNRDNHLQLERVRRRFQDFFKDLTEEAGLKEVAYYQKNGTPRYKFHTHTLRHICGCNLARGGMPIEQIRVFLGHDSIEDTKLYLQLTSEDLKKDLFMAINYPKSRLHEEYVYNQPSKTSETLQLENENMRLKLEMMNRQRFAGVMSNAIMPQ